MVCINNNIESGVAQIRKTQTRIGCWHRDQWFSFGKLTVSPGKFKYFLSILFLAMDHDAGSARTDICFRSRNSIIESFVQNKALNTRNHHELVCEPGVD